MESIQALAGKAVSLTLVTEGYTPETGAWKSDPTAFSDVKLVLTAQDGPSAVVTSGEHVVESGLQPDIADVSVPIDALAAAPDSGWGTVLTIPADVPAGRYLLTVSGHLADSPACVGSAGTKESQQLAVVLVQQG